MSCWADRHPLPLLVDPQMQETQSQLGSARTAAMTLGHQLIIEYATDDHSLGAAFADMIEKKVRALLASASPFFLTRTKQLVEQAARHALPAMYWRREPVDAGGLISYGSSTFEMYHQTGFISGESSRGRDLQICRSCSRRSLSWYSTSRRQRRLVSVFRPICLPAPTR